MRLTPHPLFRCCSILGQQALDFNRRKFRGRHFAVHHFDGTVAVLVARELDLLRVDVEAKSVAPKTAFRIRLYDEEAQGAFDLHLDAGILNGSQPLDVLYLAEIRIAVLM